MEQPERIENSEQTEQQEKTEQQEQQEQQDRETVRRIRKESLRLISGKQKRVSDETCYVGCEDYRATLASNDGEKRFHFPGYMSSKLGGSSCLISLDPGENEIRMVTEQAKRARNNFV